MLIMTDTLLLILGPDINHVYTFGEYSAMERLVNMIMNNFHFFVYPDIVQSR